MPRLEALVNRNTVMMLGSAPEYPHGSIDPIEAMGAIAQQHGIPLHVDACVGGFILPFMAMNGVVLPAWDYRVPGVTSISADLHKYGFAAKGASTITYRNLDLLKHQMFVCEDWPGGVFASPALLARAPAAPTPRPGRRCSTSASTAIASWPRAPARPSSACAPASRPMPELKVLGEPQGPLLAYGSATPEVNIFAVGDQMDAKGWQVNRLQFPDGLHAMITAQHLPVVDDYLRDLRDAVATVKADPSLAGKGRAATYGMMAHLPLRGVVKSKVLTLFANAYRAGGAPLDLDADAARRGAVTAASPGLSAWPAGTSRGSSGVEGRARPPPNVPTRRRALLAGGLEQLGRVVEHSGRGMRTSVAEEAVCAAEQSTAALAPRSSTSRAPATHRPGCSTTGESDDLACCQPPIR